MTFRRARAAGWSPTASTLESGAYDAVLVDPLLTIVVARYPDRVNRGVLWNSAKAFVSAGS